MVVGAFTTETELVVIGAGPAGCAAAIRAAERGVETTIVDERPRPGGAWLHAGGAALHDLLEIARTIRAAERGAAAGVAFAAPRVDLDQLRRALRDRADARTAAIEAAFKRLGVSYVRGRARFDNARQLTVFDGEVPRLRFRRAIVATGRRAPAPPAPAVSVADALALPDLPARLLVGGDARSLEIATVFAALGSRVTVAAPGPRLVPDADAALAAVLHAELAPRFEEIRTDVAVESIDTGDFDLAVRAGPRTPCVDGLDLERTGVTLDQHGAIVVDERMRTLDPRIFAAGDVTGALPVTGARGQGRAAAEGATGGDAAFDATVIPSVVHTDPPLAWCGSTAPDAGAVERVPHDGAAPGLTTITYDPDSQLLLGVGVVGAGAAEVVAEAALAIEMGAVLTDVAATIAPHPTTNEYFGEAARRALETSRGG